MPFNPARIAISSPSSELNTTETDAAVVNVLPNRPGKKTSIKSVELLSWLATDGKKERLFYFKSLHGQSSGTGGDMEDIHTKGST